MLRKARRALTPSEQRRAALACIGNWHNLAVSPGQTYFSIPADGR